MVVKLKPREYQAKILETATQKNTLVVLPTGVGKTLIALLLAVERLKEHPGKKILMLAPTKPLVEQHFASFTKNLPELFAEIEYFTGAVNAKERKKRWDTAEIIFSTPQCIANDCKKHLYALHDVVLLVIDEAHRCLKNYDYTTVAKFYKQQAENQRILGLTASPGSEKEKVKQICEHLQIEAVEVRTRFSEDVKPYLQDLDFNKIEVPFPEEFIEIQTLLKQIYEKKVQELKNRNLLFGPANKITLLKLQNKLAQAASGHNKDYNAMMGMSLCAQAIKISHAQELLETQTLAGLKSYLDEIQKQADAKKSKGVQIIAKAPEFAAARLSVDQLLEKEIEHPKVEELKTIVEEEFEKDPKTKIIIFAQFRDTISTVAKRLNTIKGVNAELFLGQAKKGDTGLSQKEQKRVVQDFREGKINVLCATSIGEEGLDIPEVSAVFFYEPIPSAIRKIQRAGRTARLAPGKLFILITKGTRDEIYHYASSAREKKMYKTIETVQKEIRNKPKTLFDFKQK